MVNSLVYLTRKCPRGCTYCRLRDSKLKGSELDTKQWIKAFSILKDMGVDFNLILGNETWLLGENLLHIMKRNEVPFALYTTCPEELFERFNDRFFDSGEIDNLSCGVDYPLSYLSDILENKGHFSNDMELKSFTAWKGLLWTKAHYPNVDCQGTMTISKLNYKLIPDVVQELKENGIFCGLNFIHWDKDGSYDFFPKEEEIKPLLLTKKELPELETILQKINSDNFIQNFEMLKENPQSLISMGWHCKGNPYGGPTIDSDGSLRVCGYRPGRMTSKLSIFDLVDSVSIQVWKEYVEADCRECPGCFWSYPWMYKYWQTNDSEFGKKVFSKHAGVHIPENLWSERTISK